MLQRRPFGAHGRPLLFFLLWCLGWVGVAALSLLPLSIAVPGRPPGADKLAHLVAYAGMAAAAATFCRDPARLALLALLTTALGGAVEFAQGYVPGREVEAVDALANGTGAALGYLAALTALVCLRRPVRGLPRAG